VFQTGCLTIVRPTTPSVTSGAYGLPVTDLDRLVRRLRGFSPRSWRVDGRLEVIRRLAADLVEISGEGHRLPDVPDYALPDVIAVLGADALAANAAAATALLTAALDATR
jgi:hypothetical protein